MGKKGGSRHLKRMPAPAHWAIHRKEFKWAVKPKPGPHPTDRCLPLLLVIRDMLGLARTRREAKIILSEGQTMVDGRVRREDAFPVGLMDVIEIPTINKAYRVLLVPHRGLALHAIEGKESEFKLCKILNKTSVKGGRIQLNLHDGRNILIEVKDPKHPKEDVYGSSDVLKVKIPDVEVLGHLKFDEGLSAIVTGGKNIGRRGKVVKIERKRGPYPTLVTLEDAKGDKFQTTLNYIFAVGEKKPWISLPEVG